MCRQFMMHGIWTDQKERSFGQFAIYLHKTLGARIRDLLKKVGLENHIVENKDFEIEQPVNWEEVRFKKEQFVEKSKQFIQEAI